MKQKGYNPWDVLVLQNSFPALVLNPANSSYEGALLRSRKAFGACEVVVETSAHEGDLCDLSLGNVRKVIETFAKEFERLSSVKNIRYVAEFRNKGRR